MRYPIAPNGIFTTIQGEGSTIGQPMVFVRLAGCSVGCSLCDTDYSIQRRMCAAEILTDVHFKSANLTYAKTVWITGGEPMDYDLMPLIKELSPHYKIWIATSGHKIVPEEYRKCWISVSPHRPHEWVQMTGDELKIVPGLAGYKIKDFIDKMDSTNHAFGTKFVSPCDGLDSTVDECREFVLKNRGWNMGVQAHKQWRLP